MKQICRPPDHFRCHPNHQPEMENHKVLEYDGHGNCGATRTGRGFGNGKGRENRKGATDFQPQNVEVS